MSKDSIVITVNEEKFPGDATITVPNQIYSQFQNSLTRLRVGQLEKAVLCYCNDSVNSIEIPSSLAVEFGLSDGMLTNIIINNNKLCLGPVIAVFVSTGTIYQAKLQKPSFRLTELFMANSEANTILYYFSANDVDFITQKIKGTYYNQKLGRWEKKLYPFPDVLYDRGGGGASRNKKYISGYIRAQLGLVTNIRKLNSRFYFDKWQVYKDLRKYQEFREYLPYTVLYRVKTDLEKMFARTSTIYIKDRFGSNGRGVAQAVKKEDGTYEFSCFRKKVINLQLPTFDELVSQIDLFFNNKKVILQEAIDVLEIDRHHIDMRATVQKDGSGQLGVVAYPVRVGQKKCPVTSTKSGSKVYRFEDFFEYQLQLRKNQIVELLQKINVMLFKSFRCLEEIYGNFAELGIDFAIDKRGKIWFIECNAKPGKDAMYRSYDRATIKKAFLNPLQCAKYITGFLN